MKIRQIVVSLLAISFLQSCSSQSPNSVQPSPRDPAADCERFQSKSADEQYEMLKKLHTESIQQNWNTSTSLSESLQKNWDKLRGITPVNPGNPWSTSLVLDGMPEAQIYTSHFIGGKGHRADAAADAIKATLKFLAPGNDEDKKHGFRSMDSTFRNYCELQLEASVKKVHALGSTALARFVAYPYLQKLDENGAPLDAKIENPWTGILQSKGNENGIPMMLRFSIANPIVGTVEINKKSLLLEFIPGLGLKFLISKRPAINIVAMESLAGQGQDQNFFKYDMSPDFSAHAPSEFNAATGIEKTSILARYNLNPVNHLVMNQVGKRFAQIIPYVYGFKADDINPHSSKGPHPFAIGFYKMSELNSDGSWVPDLDRRRPYRLVLTPALDNQNRVADRDRSSSDRYREVTSKAAYVPGEFENDFRYKLSKLRAGDRLYYVVGETEGGVRYRLGEINLESTPVPSEFGDKSYFIQHRIDKRDGALAYTISEPK